MKHAGGRKPEALKRHLFAEAFAHGFSYGKIAEALGIHRLTAVRWRREMKLPKRLSAGGGCSAGVKAKPKSLDDATPKPEAQPNE